MFIRTDAAMAAVGVGGEMRICSGDSVLNRPRFFDDEILFTHYQNSNEL